MWLLLCTNPKQSPWLLKIHRLPDVIVYAHTLFPKGSVMTHYIITNQQSGRKKKQPVAQNRAHFLPCGRSAQPWQHLQGVDWGLKQAFRFTLTWLVVEQKSGQWTWWWLKAPHSSKATAAALWFDPCSPAAHLLCCVQERRVRFMLLSSILSFKCRFISKSNRVRNSHLILRQNLIFLWLSWNNFWMSICKWITFGANPQILTLEETHRRFIHFHIYPALIGCCSRRAPSPTHAQSAPGWAVLLLKSLALAVEVNPVWFRRSPVMGWVMGLLCWWLFYTETSRI